MINGTCDPRRLHHPRDATEKPPSGIAATRWGGIERARRNRPKIDIAGMRKLGHVADQKGLHRPSLNAPTLGESSEACDCNCTVGAQRTDAVLRPADSRREQRLAPAMVSGGVWGLGDLAAGAPLYRVYRAVQPSVSGPASA
jgi:hypothetical protein